MAIHLQRAYDQDHLPGTRILVDRLWPRGIKKEDLHLSEWHRSVAPSTGLRQWFNHDPERWEEFKVRYIAELEDNPGAWQPLLQAAREGDLVLIYGAKDEEHNQAVVLCEFLHEHL